MTPSAACNCNRPRQGRQNLSDRGIAIHRQRRTLTFGMSRLRVRTFTSTCSIRQGRHPCVELQAGQSSRT